MGAGTNGRKKGKLFGREAPHIHEYSVERKRERSLFKEKISECSTTWVLPKYFVYSIWDTCKLSRCIIYLTYLLQL